MTMLRILGGGAVRSLVEKIQPTFEAETGIQIDGTFGAVGAMKTKLLAGEPADIVILSDALIGDLILRDHVVASSVRDVALVPTAIAVRQGDALPKLRTESDLFNALVASDEIHLPDPDRATAGIHFVKVTKQLDIWPRVSRRLKPAPNGETAMRALAASTASRPIGCTQATEISATPGVTLVASLPVGLSLDTIYTAAVTRQCQMQDDAKRFLWALAPYRDSA
jgi:molybdate transport system substrate-binding protein